MFQTVFTLSGIFIFCTMIFIFITIFTKVRHQINNIDSDAPKINETDYSQVNNTTSRLKKCSYCGSLVEINKTECESCGGKEFKKHKH